VCAHVQKRRDLKSLWNVQIRGSFICAERKGFRKGGFRVVAYVQILRELARIGVAAIIADDPRGLYHGRGRLSRSK